MQTHNRQVRASLSIVGLLAALMVACVPSIPPPLLQIPAKEQEVPVVVAVGPIDTSKVTYADHAISEYIEPALQNTIRDTLTRTHLLKDVVLLNMPSTTGHKLDPEAILSAARSIQADLLLVGEVKEFHAALPMWLFGSRYEVSVRLHTQLYNVHTGGLVWKKTEEVTVVRDGSGVRRMGSLDAIVRAVAIPSATAGLMPSLMEHLQSEYVASLRTGKGTMVADASTVFGGAELAKIDAELAPPVTGIAPKDHAYAVVVGVEDYRDLPKVDYAKRDAEMVKQYLTKALGYREQNIITLLNDRVTRSQLEARFEKWLPKQVEGHPDAEVFVYYGGHGAPDPGTHQAFLVPYDGDPAFLETTAYPLKRLYDTLSGLSAKQITVVMDSCFSGAGGRSVIAQGARPMLIKVENPMAAAQNIVVLSAAAENQISTAFPEKRHGLFTYYFLKGLQGEADGNKDGAVSIEELYGYVRPKVETAARRQNAEQSPQLLPAPDFLGARAKQGMIQLKK
jgi:hypothetical protein